MSMGGGSQQTATTAQNNDPWSASQPYLQNAMTEANNLYYYGVGAQPYQGNRVSPINTMQHNALQGTYGLASQGQPGLDQTMNTLQYVTNSQGITDRMYGAQDPLRGISTGANSIGTGGLYNNVYNYASQPTSAEANLSGMAAGQDLANVNPYLQQRVDYAMDRAADRTNSTFSGLGRYGSGAHTQALGRELGNIANTAYQQDYENSMGRMMNANQMIDANRQGAVQSQLGAAGGLTNVQGTNIANQANASSQLVDQYGQGLDRTYRNAALYPTLYNQQYAPYQQMAGVGDVYNQYQQQLIDQDVSSWYESQQLPWNLLQNYNAIASGAGSLGSAGTSTRTTPTATGTQNAIGGSLAGYGIGSMFGMPWLGALGGGLAGLLG